MACKTVYSLRPVENGLLPFRNYTCECLRTLAIGHFLYFLTFFLLILSSKINRIFHKNLWHLFSYFLSSFPFFLVIHFTYPYTFLIVFVWFKFFFLILLSFLWNYFYLHFSLLFLYSIYTSDTFSNSFL